MNTPQIRFAGELTGSLSIHSLSLYPALSTPNDKETWLTAIIDVKVDLFSAVSIDYLSLSDLKRLRHQLEQLYQSLSGAVTFETLEGCLEFELKTADRMGHLLLTGSIADHRDRRNYGHFVILLDQTFLPATLEQINTVVSQLQQGS